jgi:twitching motility protein PilT
MTLKERRTDLERLLRLMQKYGASDMHLKVGNPPIMRINGKIRYFDADPLSGDLISGMLDSVMPPNCVEAFRRFQDVDFAASVAGTGRFRLNAFHQRGSVSAAIRRVNTDIPSFEELHLAAGVMRRIADFRQGLVIVAGVTGSGKSTSLAAMIEWINQSRRCHIVTIEDPIEFLYRDQKAFINQREVGLDVESFHAALKSVVRQDPDVILIGEMRDPVTFDTALTAAETGHLVFGTLHASHASQCIGRIVDLFPPERERAIRQALQFNLKAIICQKILPSCQPSVGLVPCQEILLVNSLVQKIISEGEDKKIDSVIRGGKEEGMQDFNQSLIKLVKKKLVEEEVAIQASANPDQLRLNLKGIYLGDDRKIVN